MQKIKNNVIGSEKIEWRKLQWLQGKLKNLSESNLQKLKNSLKKGFISGFKATYLNDQLFILDGHNRQTAMTQLENEGFQFDDLLPVEIIDFEGVEVGDMESSDTKPGQREQMATADSSQTRDGDALLAQCLLFGLGHPANVAGKGIVIREHRGIQRVVGELPALFSGKHHSVPQV